MKIKEALRYTTDTVKTLLAELQKPEHNEHRWGTDQSKSLRLYLADALQDAVANHTDPEQIKSLETQAELLRNPEQHVVVRDGQVRAGRFTDKGVRQAERQALQTVEIHSGEPANWYPDIGWVDVSGQPLHQDTDGDPDAEGNHPYGTLDVTRFDNDQSNNYSEPMHYSELGRHLADNVSDYLNNDTYGWESPYNQNDIDYHLDKLRNAPYEEVDAQHPSEQPQQ